MKLETLVACLTVGITLLAIPPAQLAADREGLREALVEKVAVEPKYSDYSIFDDYDSFHQLLELTPVDLRIVRNAVLAKHGHVFKDPDLSRYFSHKSWYKPKPNTSIRLRGVENATVELINFIESGSNPRVLIQLKQYLLAEKQYWSGVPTAKDAEYTDVEIKPTEKPKIGGIQIDYIPPQTELHRRYGRLLWSYVAQEPGNYAMHTNRVYLFDGLMVRTHQDSKGEYVYAIHTDTLRYGTDNGIYVGMNIRNIVGLFPQVKLKNPNVGSVRFGHYQYLGDAQARAQRTFRQFSHCENPIVSYEGGLVTLLSLYTCSG